MVIRNNNYFIAFTSKIVFPPKEEYFRQEDDIVKRGERAYPDDVLRTKDGFVVGVGPCTAGGFCDSDNSVIFHFTGLSEDNEKILRQEINKIKTPASELKGLLVGGYKDFGFSIGCFGKILDLFKRLGIKASILWGQKVNRGTNLIYSHSDDTWTIYSSEGIDSVKELTLAYKCIHISDEDELWIGSKKISRKDIPDTLHELEEQTQGNPL